MTQEFIDLLKGINPLILRHDSTDLIAEGIIDSLGVMDIVVELGKAYNTEFDIDDLSKDNFKSAQSIWNMVERKIKNL